MEDMEEYLKCLDVIGDTNHIAANEEEDSDENEEQIDMAQIHEATAGESSARRAEQVGEEHK